MQGRTYAIYDRWKRKVVYCGLTTNLDDYAPHGEHMRKAWINFWSECRYLYVVLVQKDWLDIEELNLAEVEAIAVYNTFHDLNSEGLNFTTGGGGYGKQSDQTKRLRSAIMKNYFSDPVNREYTRSRMLAAYLKLSVREKHRFAVLESYNDPRVLENHRRATMRLFERAEFKARHLAAVRLSNSGEAHSNRIKKAWLDPEKRENMESGIRSACSMEGHGLEGAESMKELLQDRDFRESHAVATSNGVRAVMSTDSYKLNHSAGINSESAKEKRRIRWADPEYRKKMGDKIREGHARRKSA